MFDPLPTSPTPAQSAHTEKPPSGDPLRLALRPRDAARALGIGTRLLWSLTNQGLIPHLRLGRAVVYPVDQLRVWLEQKAKGGKP